MTGKRFKPLSRGDKKKLQELVALKGSAKALAEVMALSPSSISGWLHDGGVRKKNRNEIQQLWKQEIGDKQVERDVKIVSQVAPRPVIRFAWQDTLDQVLAQLKAREVVDTSGLAAPLVELQATLERLDQAQNARFTRIEESLHALLGALGITIS